MELLRPVKFCRVRVSTSGALLLLVLQLFQGNSDGDSQVHNVFETPIIAQYIRINPTRWRDRISLRVELYGCEYGEWLLGEGAQSRHCCGRVIALLKGDVTLWSWPQRRSPCSWTARALW